MVGDPAGANSVMVASGWRPLRRGAPTAGEPSDAGDPPRAAKKAKRRWAADDNTNYEAGGAPDDLENGSLNSTVLPLPASAPSRRKARASEFPTVDETMTDALTACVRRCCGLPSTVNLGRGAFSVAATVVGDPKSRSRAIALRYGHTKRDAILWTSPRGGFLCSCFGGTQNALLISASSRSTDCQHTRMLSRCLILAGVSVPRFQQRMQLREDAKNFASCKLYGASLVWTVLYKRVFSLVTFTKPNVASCIAPGCRRFRGRCGHVQLARPLNTERQQTIVDATTEGQVSIKPLNDYNGGAQNPKFLVSEKEDIDIERLPSDTARAKTDPALESVARRAMRNMLPCPCELIDADVWTRTADWRSMFVDRTTRVDDKKHADLKAMGQLLSLCNGLGYTRDMRMALVEKRCGSCESAREERHDVVKEHAVIYTHHSSAPTIAVSSLWT